ncbi:MAG: hypothetical protein AAGB00_04230 [Planctomycetota bacterium]
MATETSSESTETRPSASPTAAQPTRRAAWGELLVCLAAVLAVLLSLVNLASPWEGDQPAKATQIAHAVDTGGYFQFGSAPNYYRPDLFACYYFVSSIGFRLFGGELFGFMNLLSVVFGVVAIGSAAYYQQQALGIRPVWSVLTLLSMPLVFVSFSYGNEVACGCAFYYLSLAMLTCDRRLAFYASAAPMAASVFCRPEFVFQAPFWLAAACLVGRIGQGEPPRVRHAGVLVAALAVCGVLVWAALVRAIPNPSTTFGFKNNLKLVVAYLTYTFNPTVVLLLVPGYWLLAKRHGRYALAHLLMLAPLPFYLADRFSSPKYVLMLAVFYSLPVAYLLQRASRWGRAAIVSAILVWVVAAVSPFGVFGANGGSVWYVPTADGPIPTGSYAAFFGKARAGVYQAKQRQHIAVAEALMEYNASAAPETRIIGYTPRVVYPYAELVRSRAGKPTSKGGPLFRDRDASATSLVSPRTGYLRMLWLKDEDDQRYRSWLEQGRVRGVLSDASAVFPRLVEIGEAVPEATDPDLGRRVLWIDERFGGYLVCELPSYVNEYDSLSWVPADRVGEIDLTPVYQDARFAAYEQEVEGAEYFGYVWPRRYFSFQHPGKKFKN